MSIAIRKALPADFDQVVAIQDRVHAATEAGILPTGWKRNVYPTARTAEDALAKGELFVEEANGKICGSAIINQKQVEVYKNISWQYDQPDDQIMVLHTLMLDPVARGGGLGRAFVRFYENYALAHGCVCLRLDTNALNVVARGFYKKLGYAEAGFAACVFNGIRDVSLVMLEKRLCADTCRG